ncbi:unnamed protein product [Linum trigynum]|uniref:CCHC-type domain-containing protein n=1 Tax=Linum trigynum TaxID=586398 RepID=A0AAV2C8K2_9ROSI
MLCTAPETSFSPAIVPPQAGRPPDPGPSLPLPQQLAPSDPASFPPLNFKMALAGPTQTAPPKLNQWTFVGEHDLEPGLFGGEPELKVSDKFKDRLCSPWKKTLVVRLLGRSISYAYLCSQLRWKWRPTGRLDILDLNDRTFLVTFQNDQDFLHALTGGPWTILDHYLVVHQWSPSFRTTDKPHKSVVAWIQLPELPVHFYHREVLFALGNLIGRTVKLDYHTENMERGKFARIAVELDMTKPLATRIWLDGFWQTVLYENLPEICFECGRIGHTEESCPKKVCNVANVSSTTATTVLPIEESPPLSESPAGYGPWMQVTRKSKRQNRKAAHFGASNQGGDSGRGGMSGKANPKANQQGKGELIRPSLGKDGKGKATSKAEDKKGNSLAPKGKAVGNGNVSLSEITGSATQEWRPVGLKESDKKSQAQGESHKSGKLTGPSPSDQPTDQNGVEGMLSPVTCTSILRIPSPPHPTMKENTDPNQPTPSIRHRSQKTKSQKTSAWDIKPKSMKEASKKPLSQSSQKARKLLQDLSTMPNFPINPQSVIEFMNSMKRPSEGNMQSEGGKVNDLAMTDNSDQARVSPPDIEVNAGQPTTET